MSFGYTPTANTQGYYKFESGATDSSGNGRDGNTTNMFYATSMHTGFGNCGDFNGNNSQIVLPDGVVNNINVITVSLWANSNTQDTSQYMYITRDSGYNEFSIRKDSTGTYFVAKLGGSMLSSSYFPKYVGSRHLFTMVISGGSMYCYIDGVLKETKPGIGTTPITSFSTSIGSNNSKGYYYGKIDEVIIENTARTAQQVKDYYNSQVMRYYGEYLGDGGTNTKAIYHLNGNSTDSSGNGNNGTATNITYVDGRFGQCASFDGSSSYIDLGTPSSLSNTGAITINAWVKPSIADAGAIVFDDGSQIYGGQYGLTIGKWSPGKTSFRWWSGSGSTRAIYDASITITPGTWYNIVGVRNSSKNVSIYVNGVLLSGAFSEGGTGTGIVSSLQGLRIGSSYGSQRFNGLIDEVIIENRAWTAQEIQKYYTYALGRFASL